MVCLHLHSRMKDKSKVISYKKHFTMHKQPSTISPLILQKLNSKSSHTSPHPILGIREEKEESFDTQTLCCLVRNTRMCLVLPRVTMTTRCLGRTGPLVDFRRWIVWMSVRQKGNRKVEHLKFEGMIVFFLSAYPLTCLILQCKYEAWGKYACLDAGNWS